jgi:hypothetical protein
LKIRTQNSERRTSRGLLPSKVDARYTAQGALNLRVELIPVVHTGLGRKAQPQPFVRNAVAMLPPTQHSGARVERPTSIGVSLQYGNAAGLGEPAASPRAFGAELPRRRIGLPQFGATHAGRDPRTSQYPDMGGVGGAGRECWPRSARTHRSQVDTSPTTSIRQWCGPGFR